MKKKEVTVEQKYRERLAATAESLLVARKLRNRVRKAEEDLKEYNAKKAQDRTFEDILRVKVVYENHIDFIMRNSPRQVRELLQESADEFAKQEWNKAINAAALLAAPDEIPEILKLLKP